MTTSSFPLDTALPAASPRADRPIEDYGFVGDMRGAALVARDGAVDWLCLRRFDAEPTFFALLDADKGGSCRVAVGDAFPEADRRRYRPRTNILETTRVAARGRLVITDLMPVRAKRDVGPVGADSEAPGWFVRTIACVEGEVDLRLEIAPRFEWAMSQRFDAPKLSGGTAIYRDHDLFVAASRPPRAVAGDLLIESVLRKGEAIHLVLGYGDPPTGALDALVERLDAETDAYWQGWAAACAYDGLYPDLVLRSALCLKLLTYAPTGALVAAPTTSLPEAIGGERNWDYRFVWTRDASFTAGAFINLGFGREAAEFLRFLHEADHAGRPLRIMYAVDGDLPAERRLEHLAGWHGSRPVLDGNLAYTQDQFEIHGELLAALNLFVGVCGVERLCPNLRADLPAVVTRLAEAVSSRWREPDHGIWEIRGPATHQVHTKALCWVAMDRALKLAPRIGLEAPVAWTATRDAIMADLLERGWNAERGAYTMCYGGDELDAAVLRLPLMHVIPADDPRMRATADLIDRELSVDDLYYRYRREDGLQGTEGAFAACAYWAVGNRVLGGRLGEAKALLDKALSRANDLGLFAEEFCVETGAALGNYPQAFTHMAVIQETLRLSDALAREDQG